MLFSSTFFRILTVKRSNAFSLEWNFLLPEWMMQENLVLPAAKLQVQHPFAEAHLITCISMERSPLLKMVCSYFFRFKSKSFVLAFMIPFVSLSTKGNKIHVLSGFPG